MPTAMQFVALVQASPPRTSSAPIFALVATDHARVDGGPPAADDARAAAVIGESAGATKISPVASAGKLAKRILRM
ncbi:MAG: hypothetical protein ACLPQS_18030 [Acidimicrobiales bacterium]